MTVPPRLTADMALFLDFDGTLVDLAPTPDSVKVVDGLATHLNQLYDGLGGALALVSGRPIEFLDFMLMPTELPAAGLHGLERRMSRQHPIESAETWPGIPEIKEKFFQANLFQDGIFLEDKGIALAVHYRAQAERENEIRDQVARLAEQFPTLNTIHGHMVVEVKPAAEDKGTAVQRFLRQPDFAGRIPVFIGDDTTDEDGIRVVQELGGYGIKVGEQKSDAIFRLPDVRSVHDWLGQLNVPLFFEDVRNGHVSKTSSTRSNKE
ncbi:trehalose-phosphatase [Rhodobacteraceae bacterium RKSG542]|uniref:trehalose-phosphatase n=1 Tax=Pseudovibrio flavus TaxID=2529854 RepID=UPI0012BCD668|nr:trehalose-phosphatase [Pseudovibrio flavus]MTI16782.1 trehalose-phosphatase [Pseudovibrio flavus]